MDRKNEACANVHTFEGRRATRKTCWFEYILFRGIMYVRIIASENSSWPLVS
jgi:hypothetical protein